LLGARCWELTGLGYQGADFVLDASKGPLLLELNARPGLNVQIANRAGLLPRLEFVEAHLNELGDASERVAFAKRSFAHAEADVRYPAVAKVQEHLRPM
jgi:Sugar-transfer associated ATP-grasp